MKIKKCVIWPDFGRTIVITRAIIGEIFLFIVTSRYLAKVFQLPLGIAANREGPALCLGTGPHDCPVVGLAVCQQFERVSRDQKLFVSGDHVCGHPGAVFGYLTRLSIVCRIVEFGVQLEPDAI